MESVAEIEVWLSGKLHTAILKKGDKWFSISSRTNSLEPVSDQDYALFFRFADDLLPFRNNSESAIRTRLDQLSKLAEALDLTLTLLNNKFTDEIRSDAMDVLKDYLIATPKLNEFILARLYTVTLPDSYELFWESDIVNGTKAHELINKLGKVRKNSFDNSEKGIIEVTRMMELFAKSRNQVKRFNEAIERTLEADLAIRIPTEILRAKEELIVSGATFHLNSIHNSKSFREYQKAIEHLASEISTEIIPDPVKLLTNLGDIFLDQMLEVNDGFKLRNVLERQSPEIDLTSEKESFVDIRPLHSPALELPNYSFPGLNLLTEHGANAENIDAKELERNKELIITTLNNYHIEISKIKATVGPTVTLFEIVPASGVRISKIRNLEDDIALSLASLGVRIIAPIPGKGTLGIEVPNSKREVVSLRSLLSSEKLRNTAADLPICLGKSVSNEIYIVDLAKMPHLLMAGGTDEGKSMCIDSVIVSLLYKKHPSQIKFILVDPKSAKLSLYKTLEKHFLAKLSGEAEAIITDTKKVVTTLNALCMEMDQRYSLLKKAECRNLKEYNHRFVSRQLNPLSGHRFLPYIVLIVDEFADLIMTNGKAVEMPIARLAQLARSIGIHLILATQRPAVNIITGTIKANFPARIAFKTISKIDSRTIMDVGGAEQLIDRGDMLLSLGSDIVRLQCGFVDTSEVERVCNFIGNQQGYPAPFSLPEYLDLDAKEGDDNFFIDGERDELFEDAARVIVQNQMGSTSLIQRRLKLGYTRAGKLMDLLIEAGIVGDNLGNRAREVKFKTEVELNDYLKRLDKSGFWGSQE